MESESKLNTANMSTWQETAPAPLQVLPGQWSKSVTFPTTWPPLVPVQLDLCHQAGCLGSCLLTHASPQQAPGTVAGSRVSSPSLIRP